MITHDYSEWHEPEKPPFTVEELINAVKELMMHYHVSFDEALKHLQERDLPYNEFLKMGGLDELIQGFLDKIDRQRQDILDQYRVDDLLAKLEEKIRRQSLEVEQLAAKIKDKLLSERLEEGLKQRNPSLLYTVDWQLSRLKDKNNAAVRPLLVELIQLIQQMKTLSELNLEHSFTGQKSVNPAEAERLQDKLQMLDELEDKLMDAVEHGDLFNMDVEQLKELLGEEAARAFEAKREEIRKQFTEALQATGDVDFDENENLYKITPGAARKIGEKALKEVFSRLFTDGIGRHHATYTGDGNVEMTTTQPYEFGDSLTSLDLPSSLLNSAIRQIGLSDSGNGKIRVDSRDFMMHQMKGAASSAIVMLIDQSGSMSREGRFFNAKKLALALDALIRTEYPEDKLYFVAFSTFAKQIKVGSIPELAPKPVTVMGGAVNMRIDYSKEVSQRSKDLIPEHFTNLQKGLELARVILANSDTKNKSILLITDGAPTAFYEDSFLYLTYPPNARTFDRTLREVKAVTDENITVNTFVMGNDFEMNYFGEGEFLEKMHRINKGRLIFPAPDKLTQYVLKDYLDHKNKIIQI